MNRRAGLALRQPGMGIGSLCASPQSAFYTPTLTGGQSKKIGSYLDTNSVFSGDAPHSLSQTFYISKTRTNSSSLAPNSTVVKIVGPLANGKMGVLPAQTIVKQGGRVFIRGTVAPNPCVGKEF